MLCLECGHEKDDHASNSQGRTRLPCEHVDCNCQGFQISKDVLQQRDGEAANHLISQGYHIEVISLSAEKFNEKYAAYKEFPFGKRYAVLNENGEIIGVQG